MHARVWESNYTIGFRGWATINIFSYREALVSDIWAWGTITDHISSPSSGGRPRMNPMRIRRNHQLGDHDISRISAGTVAMVG